jgi:hypothetical protein
MGFRSFWAASSVFLSGSWSFASVRGAVFGSGRVLVSKHHSSCHGCALTRCDFGTSCSEHVNRLLNIVYARREVRAALKELHLLPELIHGRRGQVQYRESTTRGVVYYESVLIEKLVEREAE